MSFFLLYFLLEIYIIAIIRVRMIGKNLPAKPSAFFVISLKNFIEV